MAASPSLFPSVLRQLESAKIYVNVNIFWWFPLSSVTMETFLTASRLGPSTTGETPPKYSSNTSTQKSKSSNNQRRQEWELEQEAPLPPGELLPSPLGPLAKLPCHLRLISLDRLKSELRLPERAAGVLQKPDLSSPAEKLEKAALGRSGHSAEFGSACLARGRPCSPAASWLLCCTDLPAHSPASTHSQGPSAGCWEATPALTDEDVSLCVATSALLGTSGPAMSLSAALGQAWSGVPQPRIISQLSGLP